MVGTRSKVSLSGWSYMGGKPASQPTGSWVVSLLPYERGYCEPFAGMLGVLLGRKRSKVEIANDYDKCVVDWWRAVRDCPKELRRALELTPNAREEFNRCRVAIRSEGYEELDVVERARCVAVVLGQSVGYRMTQVAWNSYISRPESNNTRVVAQSWWTYKKKHILDVLDELHARMSDVVLAASNATEVLEKVVGFEDMVVYCDPPYQDTKGYTAVFSGEDRTEMLDLIIDCKASVAVSGFEGDWPELDADSCWRSTKRNRRNSISNLSDRATTATEVLWMNFQPNQGALW